jgi:uncharacterized protein YdaU (DUF1376 family)
MHYYQFNISDYQSHTKHLTPIEDICYRRLLDWQYLHEKPISNDINSICRLLMLKDYLTDVERTLNEFFILTDEGWINSRAFDEIKRFHDKSNKASEAGKASAAKRSIKNESNNQADIDHVQQSFNGRSTDVQPTKNYKPLTIKQDTKEIKKENPFLLPDWIKSDDWALWMKTRKGKKMIPAQMQKQVDKLQKWKDTGQDYAGALELAAINGYTGLYLPGNKAPPQKQRKFNASELMQGTGDGYGNPLPRKENGIIDIN